MKKPLEKTYDYSALRGKIVEKCGSIKNYAKRLNQSDRTVSLKLQNKVRFSQDDITNSIEILELDELKPYFFKLSVQQSEQIGEVNRG